MGKLSKRELKGQKEIFELLNSKDKLTFEETERFYTEANEAFITDITENSQYFTGLELAYDFALMSIWKEGVIVDMCAGWGVLSWAAMVRDGYNHDIKKIICIERDPKFYEIGKKLVQSNEHTEVIWICGDMFDVNLWKQIKQEHGEINCIYSNPPFGKLSKTSCDRSWLQYKGSEIEMAAIEIALKNSRHQAFILPSGSCTFEASTTKARTFGTHHKENKKVDKLKKDIKKNFYMSWDSVDSSVYDQTFKNTSVTVECLSICDVEDISDETAID